MANLSVQVAGLRFPHPVLCGAGPITEGEAAVTAVVKAGAGGVVARTVLAHPFSPPPEPSVVPFGRDGLLTCQRGSTQQASDWTCPAVGVPVIASLAAEAHEVGELGARLVGAGAQALEFPTTFLNWPKAVEALQALRRAVSVPIFAKLSLRHGEDIAERAEQVEPYVDGFTCISGFGPVLDIDVENGGAPRLSDPYGYGWLSGAPVKPIAVRTVFEVARRVSKPVIASGGAMTAADVVEFLQAGAALVQVTTAAMIKGPRIFGEIAAGLDSWLDAHGCATVADVQGRYLRQYGHGQRVVLAFEEAPVLEAAKCTGCTICGLVCYYDAIEAKPKQLPTISADLCFQCGLCVSACPDDALSFRPRDQVTMLPTGR